MKDILFIKVLENEFEERLKGIKEWLESCGLEEYYLPILLPLTHVDDKSSMKVLPGSFDDHKLLLCTIDVSMMSGDKIENRITDVHDKIVCQIGDDLYYVLANQLMSTHPDRLNVDISIL